MSFRSQKLGSEITSINDLKITGSQNIAKSYRDYYNEGAMDMITLRDNEIAYDKFIIRANLLRNVSTIDTSTSMFGEKISMPVGISPTAMHKLAHEDGELATSRAASHMNVPMCLSSYSNTSLEDVRLQGKDNPYIMQMCVVKDREISKQLLQRAQAAGYRAIFVSVDTPMLGRRLNEMKNNFTLPEEFAFPNLLSKGGDEFGGDAQMKANGPQAFDDTLEWEEVIPWLKSHAGSMEIWLKGVTTPADVELAIQYGLDGIVISNHGGRQLDGMPATIDALADCEPTARGRIKLAIDGGIRRGSDVFKALALGAQYCFLGRIAIWGLAYDGQAGVELGLKIIQDELRAAMAFAGCRTIREITRNHVSVLGSKRLVTKL